ILRNLSTPGGLFPRMDLPDSLPITGGPTSVAVADITRDGVPDLVTTESITGTLSVRRGLGNGAFAPPVSTAVGATGKIVVADFDGVNGPDVAVISPLTVLLNDGAGGLLAPVAYPGSAGQEVAVGDIDLDGVP